MLRDVEMRRILVRLYKRIRKRQPYYIQLKDDGWEPTGVAYDRQRAPYENRVH